MPVGTFAGDTVILPPNLEARTMRRIVGIVALLAISLSASAQWHSIDTAEPHGMISLSELLRGIQFYNSLGLHCEAGTEDGYAPGSGDQSCLPYDDDYNPQDWVISLSELLRVIQFYNSLGYHAECGTEDNFAPGAGVDEPCAEGEGDAAHPFPTHTGYAVGSLRPNHRTQTQLDDSVRAAYGRWKTNYLTGATGGTYRIKSARAIDSATVSEGQGYGMIIVAIMAGHDPDAHAIFNGLSQYVLDHPSAIDNRLMDFHVPANGAAEEGDDAAFDGDADIAYALLLAEAQWGNASGVDYHAAAVRVLAGIKASMLNPDSHLPLLGDWVDPGDGSIYRSTRPSDFMPAHFRAFARATGDAIWDQVYDACQAAISAIQTDYSPVTGLIPDFLVPESDIDDTLKPAPPDFLEGPNDGDYYYNAGRVPWRLATDFLLNGDDTSRDQAQRIACWASGATGGDPLKIAPGYYLDGAPIPPADYWTSFFTAPIGVAAMTDPSQQDWLNAVFDAVQDSDEEYYEDTVSLLSLLLMTNNYWDPTASGGVARDFPQDMRDLVIKIAQQARNTKPGFIVIPQNGQELITTDGQADGPLATAYAAAIDGQGREDLFYGYTSDNVATPAADRDYLLGFLDRDEAEGVEVLVTDYCSTNVFVDDSYAKNETRGFASFAAHRRELDAIPTYPAAPMNANTNDVNTLADAKNFLYLINPGAFANRQAFVDAADATNYDLILVDLFFDGTPLSPAQVAALQTKPGARAGSLLPT